MKVQLFISALVTIVVAATSACQQPREYVSPLGYDLNKPEKFNMPDDLEEISGIAFNNGNADTLYSEEDENGRIYYAKPNYRHAKYTTFKTNGDFEDMAICNGRLIMLQSKGRLYTLPLAEVGKDKTDNLLKFEDMLPKGDFEGMYADAKSNQVYVMCKHCDLDKTSKQTSGFIFSLSPEGKLKQTDQFRINVKHIAEQLADPKINFHPSAIAKTPMGNEWWVISSVNKLLVVLDLKFKVKGVYRLNPRYFPQPEGMAFDNKGNLYISNEGDAIEPGNVLKFAWAPGK